MRDRSEFVQMACAMALHAHKNGTERGEHVAALKATAEALADELGLREDGGLFSSGEEDAMRARSHEHEVLRDRVAELELAESRKADIIAAAEALQVTLEKQVAEARAKVRELEAQVEQLTAPAAKPKGGR